MSSANGGAGCVSASKKACSVLVYARDIVRGSRKEIKGARSSIDEFSKFGHGAASRRRAGSSLTDCCGSGTR